MVLTLLAICTGIVTLAFGADRFVAAAVLLARRLGVSPLFVGLTIVSVGTSFPELLVTTTAVLSDHSAMGLGNVVGSNIANVFLVLLKFRFCYSIFMRKATSTLTTPSA